MTKSDDSYKQASTGRGEGRGRRNSSTSRISGRKKNPLLPKKRSGWDLNVFTFTCCLERYAHLKKAG
jgi:hypothetical protein